MDDDIDRERERRALFAEFERDGDLVAERSERNSWIHEWRRVITSDEVDQNRLIFLKRATACATRRWLFAQPRISICR